MSGRRCKGSWIDNYLEYTHNQESPTAFHEWIALSIIGASLGRHVFIPRVKYTIYPNLFVILVAGSARCKKSTSISIGMNVLKSIVDPPMIFAQKITTEALIQALEFARFEGSSSGLVCASELSVFMGSEGVKAGIIPVLTDLYDSPEKWVYHTKGRGKEVLKKVTLSVLAASTKDWLRSSIPPEAIGGGFTSRIVFVYQERPARAILFSEDEVDRRELELKADLIYDLNMIRKQVKGPVIFTEQAKEVATRWYHAEWSQVRDPKLDGYYARKHDIMFKLATILSVAESNKREVTHIHIQRALDMLSENEINLPDIITSVSATGVGGDIAKILAIVKAEGKILHSDLLRKCWRFATSAELSLMIRTLIESKEMTEVMEDGGKSRYYEICKRRR